MPNKIISGGRAAANGTTRIYIGRGSHYGNPFHVNQHGTREQVIELYKTYFYANPVLMNLAKRYLKDKTLVCHCKPLACHGDIIAEYLKQFDDEWFGQ